MKKILLVDDDLAIVEALTVALEMEGYEVRSHTTGRNALEDAKCSCPDLVVLDIWLPDLDGDEVALQLKTGETTKHIPIILISAHDDLRQRIRKVKVEDYLAKPFEIDQLIEKIKNQI